MRRTIAIAAAAAVVIVLVLAQLLLPGIATQRLRDRISRSGQVLQLEVHAFPAIKLLWHRADRVVVRVAQYRSSPGHLGGQLGQTGETGSLDASTQELDAGLLTLRDATLRKRGDTLTGRARVAVDDLRRSLPILQSLTPVAMGGGQLSLRGTATLLGVTATVTATVAAQDGRLIVQPDVPFGGLATLTLFADPHVYVQGVSATPAPGGFSVSGTAQLR
jgi:LmeA-like phospholipid-binding